MHSINSSRDHHLGVEDLDVGLRVFDTCKGDFRSHEVGGYYHIHDRLGKRYGASPNWNGRTLLVGCAFPHTLQFSVQFLIGPVQLFHCLFVTYPNRPGISSEWLFARLEPQPESCLDQPWMAPPFSEGREWSPWVVAWWRCLLLQVQMYLILYFSCGWMALNMNVDGTYFYWAHGGCQMFLPVDLVADWLQRQAVAPFISWWFCTSSCCWKAAPLKQRSLTYWLHSDDQISTGLRNNE